MKWTPQTGWDEMNSVNIDTTNDILVQEAIWDNFYRKGVEERKDITEEDVKNKLIDVYKQYYDWKALPEKQRRFGLNKNLGKMNRKKIKQLKYLLKRLK